MPHPSVRSPASRSLALGLCVLALWSAPAHAADPALREQVAELFKKRQWAEAQALLEKVTAEEPANAEAWNSLGQAQLARGDHEKAVVSLERATTLDGAKAGYFLQLGNAYGISAMKAGLFGKIGFAKKCKAAYDRAVELDPRNIDARWSVMEYCRQAPAMLGGGMEGAYAQAEEIKKIDARRGRAAFALLYTTDKKYAEALALYEENLQGKPGDPETLSAIGRLAIASGEHLDRGLTALRELQAQPSRDGDARLHWRIGTILEKQGDKAGARVEYEAALAHDPQLTQAADALKKL